MKKILNLLGVITIVGSAPSALISCNSDSSNNNNNINKYDLSKLEKFNQATLPVNSKNLKSMSGSELEKQLSVSSFLLWPIQAHNSKISVKDYIVNVYDSSKQKIDPNKSYDFSKPTIVYIQIVAAKNDQYLENETKQLPINIITMDGRDSIENVYPGLHSEIYYFIYIKNSTWNIFLNEYKSPKDDIFAVEKYYYDYISSNFDLSAVSNWLKSDFEKTASVICDSVGKINDYYRSNKPEFGVALLIFCNDAGHLDRVLDGISSQ